MRLGGVTAAILPDHSGNGFPALAPYLLSSPWGAKRGDRGERGLILCHVFPPGFAYTFFKEANLTS